MSIPRVVRYRGGGARPADQFDTIHWKLVSLDRPDYDHALCGQWVATHDTYPEPDSKQVDCPDCIRIKDERGITEEWTYAAKGKLGGA